MGKNYNKGVWAEYLTAVYLFFKGYRILKTRAKTPVGEIDILASKGQTLIAVEVKCASKYEAGAYKVDYKKQHRVTAALNWIRTQKAYTQFNSFRFDAVILAKTRFYHIMDAW